MKVLIACEESQRVCKAFRRYGHEAYSCDIQECSGGHPEWHIKDDALKVIHDDWDLIIAHPPCTRLANSGVRWLKPRELWDDLDKGIKFFLEFKKVKCRLAIENPIPHRYAMARIGKYTQIIHPWQFGHSEQKATCLWLYGLPKLAPTKIVHKGLSVLGNLPPSSDRAKLRSKTYEGIADAMARQWGNIKQLNFNFYEKNQNCY